MRLNTPIVTLAAVLTTLGGLPAPASAAAGSLGADQLVELSFDELLDIEITSVSKKAENLRDAPAAVFVITARDIGNSGVRSIPDALRMVPGVQVAQIDSNKWAVTSRSFNGRFANKLLVLLDGRSIYSPLYSGVYWESQTTLLEDIERIEVIRGPGATLWGANAVNGVINIISKPASKTRGTMLTGGIGSHNQAFVGLRHGFAVPDGDARVYLKYDDYGSFELKGGNDAHDEWDNVQAGFRMDRELASGAELTLQGDLFSQDIDKNVSRPTLTAPFNNVFDDDARASGGNLLARWSTDIGDNESLQVQAYVDNFQRDDFYVEQTVWTWDLDLQHRFSPAENHDLVWGLGYRYTDVSLGDVNTVQVDTATHHNQLFSAFIQDEITLVPKRWTLTLGSKFEHNDFSGFEIQPSARLTFKPDPAQTLWAAVSRAVRTPSIGEQASTVALATLAPFSANNPGPIPLQVVLDGKEFNDSETLTALELGWRYDVHSRLSVDLAAYYNEYDEGRYAVPSSTNVLFAPVVHTRQSLTLGNSGFGEQWGIELAADWQPHERVSLEFAYSHQEIEDHSNSGSSDYNEGSTPRNQLSLRADLDLGNQLTANVWIRYVDQLSGLAVGALTSQSIPAYTEADLRLSWQPQPSIEVSLVGSNLLSPSHAEFVQESFSLATEVERSLYGYVKVDF